MEIHQIPTLRNPVMVIAFSGWNDAGEAATGALDHLIAAWRDDSSEILPQLIADVDPEDFYDFQVNRPQVFTDESDSRKITWPTTEVYGLVLPHLDHDLVIVKGVEPSMRWKSFTRELLDLADDCEVSMILTMGSLLADIPHSRPITVNITAANPKIATRLDVEISTYEGSTGILGVIHDGCQRRGIDAVSLWVPVPHYASNAPSPKASLALIHALEDFLTIAIPQDELALASDAWEVEINTLAKDDNDVAEYIKNLEESKDAADIPEISGDMIAKEFERYLRRRSQD
ncbi:MAG: PAC2 family protein [Actinobacteria bacterium]|nr:PAC2 family protein [Actinomycetota bacterium]MSY36706.1 PAC2 family protein [Actinomycetota bacterium]MTB02991.1 PAC2 family protein [Actinomycetota bacterium]MTB08309.1 PAC2 family protein [Actinomycetota bacterium]